MNPTLDTEIQNGTVTMTIPLPVSGLALHYRTDRVRGYRPDDSVEVRITGPEVPANLLRAELEVTSDGETRTDQFPPRPDQRQVLSAADFDRPVELRVGYVYRGSFEDEAERRSYEADLAGPDGGPTVTYDDENREVTLWREQTPQFAGDNWALDGLTGWTLDVHHGYDADTGICHLGDGMTQELSAAAAKSNADSDLGVTAREDEIYHVPTADATTVFTFDAAGRHRRTVDALTDATRRTVQYETGTDRPIAVTDDAVGTVAIEYGTEGPTAFVHEDGRVSIDVEGGLIRRIVANEGTAKIEYTDGGLLAEVTDSRGRTTRAAYDESGRVTALLDPWGRTTSFVRTETDDVVETRLITPALREHRYRVERDGDGGLQMYNECCGVGAETSSAVNGDSRISYPDGTGIRVGRGEDPRFEGAQPVTETVVETPTGRQFGATVERSVETDAEGRRRVIEQFSSASDDRTERIVYDIGEQVVRTDAYGREHGLTFDDRGRPLQIDAPVGAPARFEYTDTGELSGIWRRADGDSPALSFAYDGSGRVASVSDGSGQRTQLTYDALGRVAGLTDGVGATVEFDYDESGNLTGVTPPGRPEHTLEYGPADRLAAYRPPSVDGDPAATTFEYDDDDALRLVETPASTTAEFEYDPSGRLRTVRTDRHVRRMEYQPETGELDRIETEADVDIDFEYDGPFLTRHSWSGAVEGTVEYEYDGTRLLTVRVGGEPVSYEYGAQGLVSAGDIVLSHDTESGAVDGTTLGGIEDSWTRNDFGEVAHYGTTGNRVTFELDYEYDGAGRIVELIETIDGDEEGRTFEYDEAGRLTRVQVDGEVRHRFEYDANGNRTRKVGPDGEYTAEYDARDRLVRHGDREYDHAATGHRIRETSPDGITEYDYDAFGNLRSVDLPDGRKVTYVIDGANRRVARKVDGEVTRQFLYRDDLNPAAELDADGAVQSRFVYATRENVPDYLVRDGRRYRLLTDHRGSPRVVVDVETGEAAQRIDYDPYGRVVRDTNPGFQPFGFGGGIYDPVTKLVRFGARDYDPRVGRWTAPDPLGFGGGDPNLYAYVGGDPVNRVDETGEFVPILLGAIAVPLVVAAVAGGSAAFDTALEDYGSRGRIDCTFFDKVGTSYASTTLGTFAGRWTTPVGDAVVSQYVQDSLAQSRVPPDVNRTEMLEKMGTGFAAKWSVRKLGEGMLTEMIESQVARLMSLWIDPLFD